MLALKMIAVVLWFVILPFFTGLTFTRWMKRDRNSFLLAILCGYAGMFALFELISLPLIFLGISFPVLKYTYGILVLLWAGVSLVTNVKRLPDCTARRVPKPWKVSWTIYLALLLIGIQMGVYVIGMATDLDDAFYVAAATTTLETDGMFTFDPYTGTLVKQLPARYVLSPFPMLLAFLSDAVRLHPAIVAHTVMPVFFVGLAYMVYGLLGQRLFEGDGKSTGMFLCFLSLIHVFSYYSVYTQGTFLLIRIWQGKAFLAAVLLPAVFYMGIRTLKEEGSFGDWMALFAVMGACCVASSMGVMLAPIMLGILTLLYAVWKRNWKKTAYALVCSVTCIVCAGIYLVIR